MRERHLTFPLADERSMLCPICGFEYVHPTSVMVNKGGKITTITLEDSAVSIGAVAGRGVLIVLGFVCEEGHGFEVSWQFHKGGTFVEAKRNPDVPSNTIWRD